MTDHFGDKWAADGKQSTVDWQRQEIERLKEQLDKFVYAESNPEYVDPLEAEIERLTAENSVLRESIDDFLSQIEDCESAHTVCSQLTLLSKVVLQNTTNAYLRPLTSGD